MAVPGRAAVARHQRESAGKGFYLAGRFQTSVGDERDEYLRFFVHAGLNRVPVAAVLRYHVVLKRVTKTALFLLLPPPNRRGLSFCAWYFRLAACCCAFQKCATVLPRVLLLCSWKRPSAVCPCCVFF